MTRVEKPITIPVDDLPGLREFASEWQRSHCGWVNIDLTIPRDFALSVAFLAAEHGMKPDEGTHAHFYDAHVLLHNLSAEACVPVPALRDISPLCDNCDGEPEDRSAGAEDFGPGDFEYPACPDCVDGTNPTRAAEALRACLLALPAPCRRCVECPDSDHHWMDLCDDDTGEPYKGCKHCDVRVPWGDERCAVCHKWFDSDVTPLPGEAVRCPDCIGDTP